MINTVTKHTRASAAGKLIYCPHCGVESRVYHFSFSALVCQKCNRIVDKYEYLLQPLRSSDTSGYKFFLNRLTVV